MHAITVAYIFERYPVLTQTFLRRELAGLSRAGVRLEIHSMFATESGCGNGRPDGLPDFIPVIYFHWWQAAKFVFALPRELGRDPKLLRDGWRLWRQHHFKYLENFWATLWAVIFAFCQAGEFRRRKPDVLHGVRATGPATAAAILSRLCGIPFSFGGHAYDIYRHGGDAFLELKLRSARFVHTTTAAAEKYLRERAGGTAANIVLARRGLETLPPNVEREIGERPVALLSIGRLVPKKGHVYQITACKVLRARGIPFVARIIGDGSLREELQRAITHAGLGDAVTLCGALSPEECEKAYGRADIFWHTSVIDDEGDQDGLPNVIPEAFAHGLPVIANKMPATIEAVDDGVNGLIVDATKADQVANAVKRLAEDAGLRKKLGANGRRWVEENFLVVHEAEILGRAFAKAAK